jgi:predicted metalloprotease
MHLDDDESESNVEDRRGERPQAQGGQGGRRGYGIHLGLGGTLAVVALSLAFKHNFFDDLGGSRPSVRTGPPPAAPRARAAGEEGLRKVAITSFNDTQKVWAARLGEGRAAYRDAKLVLFWDATRSGCGFAESEMGPFYCPADEKVYLDLGFYQELRDRFGAPGEFAQAYVIAHEMGHHAQKLLGIEPRMRAEQRADPRRRNDLSIRLELQADCFAGLWAHSTAERQKLDPGDIQAGLGAAAAIGDDRLQKAATGRVHPESWTHGSSAQRSSWFTRGYKGGRLEDCDTFRTTTP